MTKPTTPDPITVTLNIGLDTPISDKYVQTGEDSYRSEPLTVLDLVVERTADMLAKRAMDVGRYAEGSTLSRDLRARAFARIDHEISEAVGPIIATILDGPVKRTNSYGEPTGGEFTLRELIVESARKQLQPGKTEYGRTGKTSLTEAIEQTAKAVVSKELAAEVTAAKEAVKNELAQSTAAVMVEAITKAIVK